MDKALFLLMLRCGLRVSEAVHLTLDDIDWGRSRPFASTKAKAAKIGGSMSLPMR
jgi:integrase